MLWMSGILGTLFSLSILAAVLLFQVVEPTTP
jgi:hypothetical protein